MASAFVTVGTTSFEALIARALQAETAEALRAMGIGRVILQVGRDSSLELESPLMAELNSGAVVRVTVGDLPFDVYRFKASIADDLRSADVVISHAGAHSFQGSSSCAFKHGD